MRAETTTAEPKVAPAETGHADLELASDSPWHVILLDDAQHSYDYVIEMLGAVFGYSLERAFLMALEVDTLKRVIVATCHLERAEAFQAAIHDYGADWRIPECKGSMSAILKRAR